MVDPSSGSYYIEKLTDALAEAAWKQFQEIEAKGGFINA
ncbi:MAG: methylmalonyl-CoA mutase family protein [Saprospiraceae bacterium]